MQQKATDFYQRTRQKTAPPRELEAGLLLLAAAHLQSAIASGFDPGDPAKGQALARAMTFNCKIWTILATCAMRADSALPQQVRQELAELGLFVIGRTANLLQDFVNSAVTESVAVLIEINRTIASGLRA